MSPTAGSTLPANILDLDKEDMVATVCHKLRTPLTAALGFMQLSMRDSRDPEAHLRNLRMVDEQLRRMARMIDELAAKAGE
jgi:signal transduction histidine kinase